MIGSAKQDQAGNFTHLRHARALDAGAAEQLSSQIRAHLQSKSRLPLLVDLSGGQVANEFATFSLALVEVCGYLRGRVRHAIVLPAWAYAPTYAKWPELLKEDGLIIARDYAAAAPLLDIPLTALEASLRKLKEKEQPASWGDSQADESASDFPLIGWMRQLFGALPANFGPEQPAATPATAKAAAPPPTRSAEESREDDESAGQAVFAAIDALTERLALKLDRLTGTEPDPAEVAPEPAAPAGKEQSAAEEETPITNGFLQDLRDSVATIRRFF